MTGLVAPRLVIADDVVGQDGNAVEIAGGSVLRVGPVEELRRPGLSEERYPGGVIVPGIVDAHFHPVAYASLLNGLSLKTAADFADLQRRIQNRAAGLDQGRPLIGVRLDDETLAERRLPTRHDLDAWVSDRPVVLHRYCGHIAVANTAALKAGGIDASTVDPEGGSLDRDEEGPTGVVRETAIELVAMPLAGSNRVEQTQLVDAMTALAGLGITSIGAIVGIGDGPWAELGNEVEIVAEAARDLPIKLHCFVIANTFGDLHEAAGMLGAAGARVSFAGVKRFGDGSLGGHTAAMCLPFTDRPETSGLLRLDPEADGALARAAIDLGGRVAVHAIGDCAVGASLDLCESLIARGAEPSRLRIEHVSVITESDIDRFSRLGVTAVVQPAFIGSETEWLEARVGPDRIGRTYAFRSLLDAGVALAGSSDCPVEPPDPWAGMALARDRAGLVPEQSLTGTEALGMFTAGSASAIGLAPPLSTGSAADLVVIDRDPTSVTPDEVRQTQ
ncbi:MAG: amidohydrolase, partial [Acidimicrobiia bacterium]|nr:amidohydrolase [Acidimicrobiia bacterium]